MQCILEADDLGTTALMAADSTSDGVIRLKTCLFSRLRVGTQKIRAVIQQHGACRVDAMLLSTLLLKCPSGGLAVSTQGDSLMLKSLSDPKWFEIMPLG